jgi:pilus assembly protein Flp/PilA
MRRQSENSLSLLRRFAADNIGASAIEYGLLIAGISIAIVAVPNSVGQNLLGFYAKLPGAAQN